jgi:hypothetical protein
VQRLTADEIHGRVQELHRSTQFAFAPAELVA